jgi:hypothetical protein
MASLPLASDLGGALVRGAHGRGPSVVGGRAVHLSLDARANPRGGSGCLAVHGLPDSFFFFARRFPLAVRGLRQHSLTGSEGDSDRSDKPEHPDPTSVSSHNVSPYKFQSTIVDDGATHLFCYGGESMQIKSLR